MFKSKPMLWRHAAAVGLFVVGLYVLCLVWRVLLTDPEVVRFHLLALKTTFPGFQGMDAASMLWGGVLSFVYGAVASVAFHGLHRGCCGLKG